MKKFYVLLILLCVYGCAGIQYQDRVTAIELSTTKNEISSKVLAKADEWRNSGVSVIKGNNYKITTKGRWYVGGA